MRTDVKVGILVAILGVVIESLLFQTVTINLKNIVIDFITGTAASYVVMRWVR